MIDEILKKFNLNMNELQPEELQTLLSWADQLQSKEATIADVRFHISQMKEFVEQELTAKKELPNKWLHLLSYFIPFVGIVEKWYQDQYELGLKARLRNYMLLEAFLASPERRKKAIESQIERLAANAQKRSI